MVCPVAIHGVLPDVLYEAICVHWDNISHHRVSHAAYYGANPVMAYTMVYPIMVSPAIHTMRLDIFHGAPPRYGPR